MIIIGAGVIGVELGSVWSRLGSEVSLCVEIQDFVKIIFGRNEKRQAYPFCLNHWPVRRNLPTFFDADWIRSISIINVLNVGDGCRVFGPYRWNGHRHGGIQDVPENQHEAGAQVQATDEGYLGIKGWRQGQGHRRRCQGRKSWRGTYIFGFQNVFRIVGTCRTYLFKISTFNCRTWFFLMYYEVGLIRVLLIRLTGFQAKAHL